MSKENAKTIYLVDGKRTPFGKFGGSFAHLSPVDLAEISSKALLSTLGLSAESIDHVVLGSVVPTTTDTIYGARHLAIRLGCLEKTPAYNVNRLCGSGLQAIIEAFQQIALGRSSCVLASGVENMSMAPHLVYGARFGTKYGSLQTVDMLLDALTDKQAGCPMGVTAENLAQKYAISREECDEYALNSHKKVAKAYEVEFFKEEITSVQIRGNDVAKDEHVRFDATLDEMKKLKASFKKDGVTTAANASGIVDGSASVLVASGEFCENKGLEPIAKIIDYDVYGVDPTIMGIGPVPVIQNLLARNNLSLDQIDFIEINEAFAAQTLACAKELKIDMNRLNPNGGAISLGHPLAASGTRIALTLAKQLKKSGKKIGIASACIGGGQGIGILLEKV